MSRKLILIAFVVSLGGFLFGFDAGIISGVMNYAGPEFDLNVHQSGWVVSSPTFAAMIAMLFSGRLSDKIGRKKILIAVAFLYALSALLSAYAASYEMLYIARMVGGLAFGAALILAPTYIAEISTAENRGKLVSIQQLNIVLGFFVAFLSNYYLNKLASGGNSFLSDEIVWRWMLGLEMIPAVIYLISLFFVPKSPRWLFANSHVDEAKTVLRAIHGKQHAQLEIDSIEENIRSDNENSKVEIKHLFKKIFALYLNCRLGLRSSATNHRYQCGLFLCNINF